MSLSACGRWSTSLSAARPPKLGGFVIFSLPESGRSSLAATVKVVPLRAAITGRCSKTYQSCVVSYLATLSARRRAKNHRPPPAPMKGPSPVESPDALRRVNPSAGHSAFFAGLDKIRTKPRGRSPPAFRSSCSEIDLPGKYHYSKSPDLSVSYFDLDAEQGNIIGLVKFFHSLNRVHRFWLHPMHAPTPRMDRRVLAWRVFYPVRRVITDMRRFSARVPVHKETWPTVVVHRFRFTCRRHGDLEHSDKCIVKNNFVALRRDLNGIIPVRKT
jgi:hypothetical protein